MSAIKYNASKLRVFARHYIASGGNATAAAQQLDPTISKVQASILGSKLARRLDLGDVLDAHGVTNDRLVTVLSEGLASDKYQQLEPEASAVPVPDYKARHKYLETGLKLKGYLQGNQTVIDNRKLVIALPPEAIPPPPEPDD